MALTTELWALCVALCVLGAVLADDDHGKIAAKYTAEQFKEQVGAGKAHFVMFYAPWCGHCKRLAPTFDEVASHFLAEDEERLVVAKVDCTEETALCSEHGVSGYPTVLYFKPDGTAQERYRGERDLTSLVKYCEASLDGKPPPQEKPKRPAPAPPAEEAEGAEDVITLTADTFRAHLATEVPTLVKFYAPWCGHCKSLAPTYAKLATSLKEHAGKVAIAKVDCTVHRETCTQHEVRGYPTLLFFSGGSYEKYASGRDLASLQKFIKEKTGVEAAVLADQPPQASPDKKADKPKPQPVKEEEPAADDGVLMLTADTFDDVIAEDVNVFVKFYAPWCGHCKRLAPAWSDLAKRFSADRAKKIVIAKVDCTKQKDLCQQYGVRGYPTLKLFQNGKLATDYQGGRELETLAGWVLEQSTRGQEEKTGERDEL